ncbi:MAG TPA: hypothetical protein VKY74_04035 [Chloroflexia bacterium]|nr:hypothetical protein [Chloroflexia bacterium]
MAPPRLPRVHIERLIPVLAAVPDLAPGRADGRPAFLQRAHLPDDLLHELDPHATAETVAARLLGYAATLWPWSTGPRQGRLALGDLLAVVLTEPAVAPADKEWVATLAVRYALIARAPPDPAIPPAVYAQLAQVPPQPPPYWDHRDFGMPSPPADRRAGLYRAVQAAAAAGEWERVLELEPMITGEFAIPEVAAEAQAALARSGIELPALVARARAELEGRG